MSECQCENVSRKSYRAKETWLCEDCGRIFIPTEVRAELGPGGTAPGGETVVSFRVHGLGTFYREDMARYVCELFSQAREKPDAPSR